MENHSDLNGEENTGEYAQDHFVDQIFGRDFYVRWGYARVPNATHAQVNDVDYLVFVERS